MIRIVEHVVVLCSYNLAKYYHLFRQLSPGCSDRLRDLRVALRTTWPAEDKSHKTNLISFHKQCAVLRGIQPQPRVDETCDNGATGRYLGLQIVKTTHILTTLEVKCSECLWVGLSNKNMLNTYYLHLFNSFCKIHLTVFTHCKPTCMYFGYTKLF